MAEASAAAPSLERERTLMPMLQFVAQAGQLFRRARLPLLLTLAAFAGGAATGHLASATPQNQSPYALLDQLARVLVLVETEYVEPVERQRLVEGAIKGMVSELDPHSSYLPPDDYGVFRADTEGRFGGIGVEVDFEDDYVTIIAPIEGSPAAAAGVRPGDRIVAIDNVPVRGRSFEDLVRQMRGAPGTTVALTIRRSGTTKLLQFTLTRRVIEVASISSKLLEGRVGYVRIKTFQTGTHAEFLDAVARLRTAADGQLEGVLLDMRNNPGGLVNEASAVADEFLASGVIYSTRHRGRVVDEVRATRDGALQRGPVVILVNEYSASASELVAGALRDHRRGFVVGATTFGKGSVQSIIDLPGGAGIRLTSMRYYTPSGHSIQAQGIQPDVAVQAAYVADKSFGVVRESDLENHLPAEGPPGTAAPQVDAGAGGGAATDGLADAAAPTTHLGVAREAPSDPTRGDDLALSVGYQIVRGILPKQR
jgi:carboxyl-terminal processing protease